VKPVEPKQGKTNKRVRQPSHTTENIITLPKKTNTHKEMISWLCFPKRPTTVSKLLAKKEREKDRD